MDAHSTAMRVCSRHWIHIGVSVHLRRSIGGEAVSPESLRDIADQLSGSNLSPILREAADEIERLRAENARLIEELADRGGMSWEEATG